MCPPLPIIINEWLLHDIRGDNGLPAQQRVESFLETLRSGTARIIVIKGSKWDIKAWGLWNYTDTNVRLLSKLLYLGVLIDPLKCQYLNPDQVQALPQDLAEQVPLDDVYLFQTALAGGAQRIITTDGRLINLVSRATQHGIQLIARDVFYDELGL